MRAEARELTVRQHERHACDTAADVVLAPESADRVRLSRSAQGKGGGIPVSIIDFSRGGLGLRSTLFLPRLCRVRLRLTGDPAAEVVALTVRRVRMIERTPTYYLGVSFDSPEQSARLLARLTDAEPPGREAPA